MQPTDPHESPTTADEMLGRVVDGRYRVERVLGEGGLGRVYVARNLRLDREVALKVLLAQHAATPTLRARFEREAKTLSALSHPNIVTVTDFGLDGEEAFVVMELVQGENLADLLAESPPAPEVAIGIMRSVLSALAYAHEQGVVHRDLKPSNVLVRELPDGAHHVEVLDFGLAKFLDDDDTEGSSSALTKSGVMLGTPAYMSPEQACGDAVDARSDVYSAGLLLYELVVGRRPMPEHTGPQLLKARLTEPPPTFRESAPGFEVHPGLEALLGRALSSAPEARFADAGEMQQALDALGAPSELVRRRGEPPAPGSVAFVSAETIVAPPANPRHAAAAATAAAPTRPPGRLRWWMLALGGAGVMGLLLVAGLAWLWLRPEPLPPRPDTATRARPTNISVPTGNTVARPPARDPWEGVEADDLHERVSGVWLRLNRGGEPSEAALRRLYVYANNHPEDPLPRLLVARGYALRGWYSAALPEFERVLRDDVSVRGDPHVLPLLLRIVRTTTLHERASRIIATAYGAEAIPAVDAQLASSRLPDRARPQMQALRARLEGR